MLNVKPVLSGHPRGMANTGRGGGGLIQVAQNGLKQGYQTATRDNTV